MQDRLSKVQQLQATERAFAAILADGLVTTWGDRCRQTPRCCGLIFSGRGPPDNYSGVIPRHFPAGCCQMQRSNTAVVVCRLFHSARLAQQSAATSSHRACICRDIGRWIGDYLGWSRLRWWRFCSRRPHIPSLLHVPKPYFSGKPKTFCWLRMVTTHSTRNTHDWIIYDYDFLIFLKIS